jgi:deoxyribodipyrimidine photo-lyase
MDTRICQDRLKTLNEKPINDSAKYVLYWMQQSQRAFYNHALEHAVEWANELGKGLVVAFVLMDDYPDATERSFAFMLEGLVETGDTLKDRNIKFVMRIGKPVEVIPELAKEAAVLITDRGYLRHQRQWRKQISMEISNKMVQVETDAIVPVEVASDKREYAARTIRSKLMDKYKGYLKQIRAQSPTKSSMSYQIKKEDYSNIDEMLQKIKVDSNVKRSEQFQGGTTQAKKIFKKFLDQKLSDYDDDRNQPQKDKVSYMSMYLHFGQISPVWIANQLEKMKSNQNTKAYLEELLVRRELAINFVYYTDNYDDFDCLPDWAQKTLNKHDSDDRPHQYTRKELEDGCTHDEVWNTAMEQMKQTGYLHNYMRMYWGKKILEWSSSSRYAYKTLMYLNNKYFIDGRDCSSYANVAWVFGLHDRAWQENEVFGKVRSMTRKGLERKFDSTDFIEKVKSASTRK